MLTDFNLQMKYSLKYPKDFKVLNLKSKTIKVLIKSKLILLYKLVIRLRK